MQRLFKTHQIRKSDEIAGLWDFEADHVKAVMPVPSCWEMQPEFKNYRGIAVYTKQLELDAGNLLLTFKAVSHTATVYLDEVRIGRHYGAYTPFTLYVANVSAGKHALKVVVDNSFNKESALSIPNDYFTYGGIIRPVIAEIVGDDYIERLECSTSVNNGRTTLKVRAYLHSSNYQGLELSFTLNHKRYQFSGIGDVIEQEFEVEDVKLWNIQTPNLYLIKAILSRNSIPVDDLIERIGFRTVEVSGRNILINGESVFLKGFCRHEDSANFGASLPFQTQVADLRLLKETGSNIVRTSHYPNDELFLDLCDELGLFVWEESHARGLSEAQMRHPNFEKQSEDCIREMISNHYNHPAIIIWALLNECASDTEFGATCYEKQINEIRRMDQTRPVTYASCKLIGDRCLALADIVSYNIYSGWYEQRDTTEFMDKLVAWSEKNGAKGKPYIVSELGAGAIYGFRDFRHVKWSEERQAEILDDNLKAYYHQKVVRGEIIWQFSDCRVSDENFSARPKSQNNKGVLDEYRRPKLAFQTVQNHFKNIFYPDEYPTSNDK